MAETINLPRSAAGPNSPWLIAVIVSIATFMEVLDTTIANVSLRHIAGTLAAGQDESTYIITSYLVANAIVLPISGWLANVIGRKRFYMICVALFTVSSVACGFATSLPVMLAFRVLQGLGGGGLAPVEQSIYADSFTPAKRAIAFSIYGFTVVTAPAIGPVLGGWLTDNYSWQWVFFINLPVGILSLILTYLFVHDSPRVQQDRRELLDKGLKIDYVGFLLVAVGFGALQVVLDRFERDDGFDSPFILSFTLASVVSLIALIVWELLIDEPVINLRLLRSRAFAISNIIMFVFGFIIIASTQLMPQLVQALFGYDATTAGLTLALGGISSVVAMPIAGVVTGTVIQPRWLLFAALFGTAASMRYAADFSLATTFAAFSVVRAAQVVWLPFIFIGVSAVQFIGVPEDKNNDASAIINMMRNLGGSVGVAVVTTELAWRGQFHTERLSEHITPYNGFSSGPALQTIAGVVATQSAILSYLDVFIILALTTIVVCPLALFIPRMPKGGSSAN